MTPYSIEPELDQRTPRQIERRHTSQTNAVGCVRVFLIPFILVGLGAFGWAVVRSLQVAGGQMVNARVVDKGTSYDSDSGTSYSLTVSYRDGNAILQKSASVDQAMYDATERGAVVPAIIMPGMPSVPPLVNPTANYWVKQIGLAWFFALFWNAIVGAFVWGVWFLPGIEKRLYMYGSAATGRVTKKQVDSGDDSTTYRVHYDFQPEGSVKFSGRQVVAQLDYDAVQVGDTMTILYDPNRPTRNVAYPLGGYRVV